MPNLDCLFIVRAHAASSAMGGVIVGYCGWQINTLGSGTHNNATMSISGNFNASVLTTNFSDGTGTITTIEGYY